MARKRTQEATVEEAPISLIRIEERIEYVALTDAEKVARLEAAGGIEAEISNLEKQHALISDEAKGLKQEIEVKGDELRRAIREANEGTKGATFPCVVERHPDHASEMQVWRVPEGVEPQAVVGEQAVEGETLEKRRERQGCTLVETRAMSPDELRAAEAEDYRRRHPELPFPDAAAKPPLEVIVGGKDSGTDGIEEQPGDGEKKGIAPCLCPAILQFGTLITDDVLCGQPGSRRKRGLCEEHQRADAGVINDWLARRDSRKKELARLEPISAA